MEGVKMDINELNMKINKTKDFISKIDIKYNDLDIRTNGFFCNIPINHIREFNESEIVINVRTDYMCISIWKDVKYMHITHYSNAV
jgi:hypothetical protein